MKSRVMNESGLDFTNFVTRRLVEGLLSHVNVVSSQSSGLEMLNLIGILAKESASFVVPICSSKVIFVMVLMSISPKSNLKKGCLT